MSELLRVACEEAKNGNSCVKQQVRDIGNKFLLMPLKFLHMKLFILPCNYL